MEFSQERQEKGYHVMLPSNQSGYRVSFSNQSVEETVSLDHRAGQIANMVAVK